MEHESKGLLGSLAEFVTILISIAHTRLEILSLDIEEDRAQLLSLLALYVIAMFCLIVGLVISIILVVLVLWMNHHLIALSLVAGFFFLVGAVICYLAIHKTKNKPRIFSASLLELLKDKEKLDAF